MLKSDKKLTERVTALENKVAQLEAKILLAPPPPPLPMLNKEDPPSVSPSKNAVDSSKRVKATILEVDPNKLKKVNQNELKIAIENSLKRRRQSKKEEKKSLGKPLTFLFRPNKNGKEVQKPTSPPKPEQLLASIHSH